MITFKNVPHRYLASITGGSRYKWPDTPLALIRGPKDAGKTHAVIDCVFTRMKEVAASNPNAKGTGLYVTHREIVNDLSKAMDLGRGTDSVITNLKSVHILVIDEFCVNPADVRDHNMAVVRDVICHRADAKPGTRNTFIITTQEKEWLGTNLEGGLSSRLLSTRGGESICKISEVAPRKNLPPLGPPHVIPAPAWVDVLGSLLADLAVGYGFVPRYRSFHQVIEKPGIAWAIADRIRELPDEAMVWLETNDHPALQTIQSLKGWWPPHIAAEQNAELPLNEA